MNIEPAERNAPQYPTKDKPSEDTSALRPLQVISGTAISPADLIISPFKAARNKRKSAGRQKKDVAVNKHHKTEEDK